MILVAECRTNEVDVSVSYDDQYNYQRTVTKDEFTVLVVAIDVLVVILYIIFYNRLEEQQIQFVEKFEGDTIQMTDFTVMLENLPPDKFFNGDEDVMRMYLWQHCETIL